MQEEIRQIADSLGGGFWATASAIVIAVFGAAWGFIKWSVKRIYTSNEERMDKMEQSIGHAHNRIDDVEKNAAEIKDILGKMMTADQVIKLYDRQSDKLERFAERVEKQHARIDEKQDQTNNQISSLKDYLMSRPHNERRGDEIQK